MEATALAALTSPADIDLFFCLLAPQEYTKSGTLPRCALCKDGLHPCFKENMNEIGKSDPAVASWSQRSQIEKDT